MNVVVVEYKGNFMFKITKNAKTYFQLLNFYMSVTFTKEYFQVLIITYHNKRIWELLLRILKKGNISFF